MYKKISCIAMGLAILAGCQKDPGLLGPKDSYSTTNFPSTLNDLNSVLVPCYSNLRDPNLFGFNFLTKMTGNITHTVDCMWNGEAPWNQMSSANLDPTNAFSQGSWAALYTGVKSCNVALKALDFYQQTYAKPQDEATIKLVKGQILFLRAYHYFNLECLYGESYITTTGGGDKMGVPIFATVAPSLDSAQKSRSKVKEVWNFIISDLKTSAQLLQGKVWAGNDQGRISEWAAKGLLGKAYVFTQDWPNAKTTLQDVIQNSGKSLMPFDKYKDAFVGISANEFNEESLFELNIDQDSKGNYGVYGGNPNSTSITGLIGPPWALGKNGTEGASFPMGYGNQFFHDKNVLRFGFKLGGYDLVSNPGFDVTKAESYTNPKLTMDPVYKQNSMLDRTKQTSDPRLYVNALQPWVDAVKPDGVNWYPVSKPSKFAGQKNKYGWSMKKYAPIFNDINNVGPADAANFYLLRLADIYLLFAETAKASGDNVTALEYINKVKRRAYGLPVNTPSAIIDYASLTAATSAQNDPVLGNNPLYYERFAELFNEGHWWYDVCRWRIGSSEAAYYGSMDNVGTLTWTDKTYSWPIPTGELNSNAAIKGQQNPGYPQ